MSRSAPDRSIAWLGIDARGAAWMGGGEPSVRRLDAPPGAAGTVIHRLVGALPAPPREVRVVVADALARHWLQAPPSGASSLEEMRRVASARCTQLFGGGPTDWAIRGDWHARRPFACAALPQALVRELEDAASAKGLRLSMQSFLSVWLAAGAQRLPDDGWFAIRSFGQLSLGHNRKGCLTHLQSAHAAPDDSGAMAQRDALDRVHAQLIRWGSVHPASVHTASVHTASVHTASVHWLDLRQDAQQARPQAGLTAIRWHARAPAGAQALGDAGLCAWVARALETTP